MMFKLIRFFNVYPYSYDIFLYCSSSNRRRLAISRVDTDPFPHRGDIQFRLHTYIEMIHIVHNIIKFLMRYQHICYLARCKGVVLLGPPAHVFDLDGNGMTHFWRLNHCAKTHMESGWHTNC